eukprot:TRINITY_DN11144_c0_g1_i1.p1 TRINITY_DN11144_c0_g1~~TRINITY_DN11144_c0_g1_i1.p1  ORF type:complete len:704 (-),score=108.75 TRINITY_DN11144_c0_g1_i1:100-2211(-)
MEIWRLVCQDSDPHIVTRSNPESSMDTIFSKANPFFQSDVPNQQRDILSSIPMDHSFKILNMHSQDPQDILYSEEDVVDISDEKLPWSGRLSFNRYQLKFNPQHDNVRVDVLPVFSIAKVQIRDPAKSAQILDISCKDLRLFSYRFPDRIDSNSSSSNESPLPKSSEGTSRDNSAISQFLRSINEMLLPISEIDVLEFARMIKQDKLDPTPGDRMGSIESRWSAFDYSAEFTRQGLKFDGECAWKRTDLNEGFAFSPTYPKEIFVPAAVTNKELEDLANHRSKRRIPCLTWYNKMNEATLTRCSQPHTGLMGYRNEHDEKLIEYIRLATTPDKKLHIIDCRSQMAVYGNTVIGAGTESLSNYLNCDLTFLNIANIHKMRDSLKALGDLLRNRDSDAWLSALEATGWLGHVSGVLAGAAKVATLVHDQGIPTLVHCSDGWDRTSQVCALAQIMIDPYYRSLQGFQALIEKEWLGFGHKFTSRCSHGNPQFWSNNECAPIFLQWVDCVHQLQHQFPTAFEFNELFLFKLVEKVYSCEFGDFLCDDEKEREENHVRDTTLSFWMYIRAKSESGVFDNISFDPLQSRLRPKTSPKHIVFWDKYYHTYCEEHNYTNEQTEKILHKRSSDNKQLSKEIEELKGRHDELQRQIKKLEDELFLHKQNADIKVNKGGEMVPLTPGLFQSQGLLSSASILTEYSGGSDKDYKG